MKNRLLKTFTSLVLTILMVISVMPAFAITIGAAGEPTYVKVGLEDIQSTDKIIIVSTHSTNGSFAMSNDNGTSTAPKAVSVTVKNDTITTSATNILWNISNEDGNLTIYPAGTTDTWLYCTNTNNGVRVSGKNDDKVFTLDENTGYLQHTATSRYLGVYNKADWRCYTNTTGNTANQTFSFYKLVDKNCAHSNTQNVTEVPATCTTPGTTAGVFCNDCETYISGHEEISAPGHNFVNGECTVCHEKQPTKLTINRDSFSGLGSYKWYQWTATATTNESVSGYAYVTNNTDSIQMNTSKTTRHIYNNIALPGKIVSIKLTTKDAKTFAVWTSPNAVDQSATTGLEGFDSATKKEVTSSGTTWTFNTTDRFFVIALTDGGAAYLSSIEITYEVCNHTNTESVGAAKEATCTEDGITAGSKCSDCGEILEAQATIPATGHKDANKDYTCDVCGAKLCTEHAWVGGEIIKAPTCTETGLQAQYCSNCNQPNPEDKVLEMIDHTPETDAAKEPTCTSTGLTEGSHCSVCKTVIVEQTVIPKKDHNYVDNKCSVCGDIRVQGSQLGVFQFGENGSAGHKDGSEISAGTIDTSGNYTLTLTSCTKVYGGAFDAKNKSALKLGTGSGAASLSFKVDNDVNTVVIYIAGYKAEAANIEINGTAYAITSKSDEGDYTKVVVDTTTNKIVTLKTLSGGYRAMIDSIEFWGYAPVVKSFGLSLNDGVTVKVTFDIPEAWLTANAGAKVVFSNGEKDIKTIDVVAGENVCSVDLTPAQINDALKVKITDAKGKILVDEKDVSVSAYKAKVVAAKESGKLNYTDEKYNALIALIDAALTYSNAADGTIVEELTETFTGVADYEVLHAKEDDKLFAAFSGQLGTDASIYINVDTANVKEGDKLVLKIGETGIINDDIAKYITKDGQIVISGLYPANFDDTIYIEASTERSNATFTFNSYLKAIYNSSSEKNVKNLAVATYLYGLAAEAYLTAQ